VVHWDNRGGIALFLLPDSPGGNRCKEIADRNSSKTGEAFCNGVRCREAEAYFDGATAQAEKPGLIP
jgi:hypothetical protein